MKEAEGRLAKCTIIIVPILFIEIALYLVLATDKVTPAAIRQRSTKRMCHDGEASQISTCQR